MDPDRAAEPATNAGHVALADAVLAHNYDPLPVVLREAQGAWVTDVEGRRYLDCLAGYSALNFGHRHPALVAAARAQLDRLTLTSRAFHSDRLGPFARDLAALARLEAVLPVNTGAEAVEAALKVARRWGTTLKGVPEGSPRIIVAEGNFHGRTTTIVGFSTDPVAREGFGPFTPGFDIVPYGDAAALAAAVTDRTVAVLLEPIQGEAGVIVPPPGYLAEVRRTCTDRGILLIADEIQSGLGRTGATFACDQEDVQPDVLLLGKALGGGILPVSAVVARWDVLGVLTPGSHGSTFGGNPLAAAVGHAVVGLLETGELQDRARVLGEQLHRGLAGLVGHGLLAVRGRGLWAGVDVDPALASAGRHTERSPERPAGMTSAGASVGRHTERSPGRPAGMTSAPAAASSVGRVVCERLAERGVLCKETHGATIRLAPTLVIEEHELDWLLEQLHDVLDDLAAGR